MAKFILSAFSDEAAASLADQITALKENGITRMEPRFINEKAILAHTDEELVEIEKTLSENGIKVGSLGSPIGKYNIEDDFDEHLKLFERALRTCELLKTDKMRMFSFFVKQDELSIHRDEVIRRMNVMCELAEKRGITLCHENESLIYGQMPAEVRDLLTSVKGLKGIFDAANYRMNNADPIDGIEATLTSFAYVHIKDAHYESQMVLPAGEGEGRIAEVIDIVNAHTDGEVLLTLEPHLMDFLAYKTIDEHELKGKYSFKNNREAFDFAAAALKKLLTDNGYREVSGKWIK